MDKTKLCIAFLLMPCLMSAQQRTRELRLTLEQSAALMMDRHPAVQIADRTVGIAQAERQRLNAFWLPSLTASGAYVRFANDIAVKQSLKPVAESAKDFLDGLLPEDGFIAFLLDGLATRTLTLPLLRSNVTSVAATLSWPVFTGGKRLYASRIGRRLVDLAEVEREQVEAVLQVELVQTYYALQLAAQVAQVRREALNGLQRHYDDALKMEANGLIDKAARLFAQVSRDEAKREWEAAEKDLGIARSALNALLRLEVDSVEVCPVSPLFMGGDLPGRAYFRQLISGTAYPLRKLRLQEDVAENEHRIARSAYLPNIALTGSRTLYARHLPRNLMPRAWVGVGFTWNLFDGLSREAGVRRTRLVRQNIESGQTQTKNDLEVLTDQLYSELEKAQEEAAALHTTVRLGRELLRMRRKAFGEGMATSADVINAEVMLSGVRVAQLSARFRFDVALATLCSTCGAPDLFWKLKQQL